MVSALSYCAGVAPIMRNLRRAVGLPKQSLLLVQGTGSTSPFVLMAPRAGHSVRTTMPIATRTACGAPQQTCRARPTAAAAPPRTLRCMVRRALSHTHFLCHMRAQLMRAGSAWDCRGHLMGIVVRNGASRDAGTPENKGVSRKQA